MSLPTITNECILAVLSKATQKDPSAYGADALLDMMKSDQITLASAIVATAEGFGGMIAEDEESSQLLVISIVAMGTMVYEIIKSQVEAKELEEMFAE